MELSILYEDRALAVCCKPAGVLAEAGSSKGMPELLAETFRAQGKRDLVFGVHRLDKNVGGVMLFSRQRAVTRLLIGMIRERKIEKEYFAVLRGRPDAPEGTLNDLLFHDARCNKSFVVARPRKGVRDASLDYRVLAEADHDGQTLTLVRVRLHTGRTHQIRVQFASRGLPLLGDIRYGSHDPDCDVSLWATRLCFVHPDTHAVIDVSCPPPARYPWNLFPVEALQ